MKPSAIIIGTSSGIGLELCRHLAGKDYRIGIAARRKSLLAEQAASLPQVCWVAPDLSEVVRIFQEQRRAKTDKAEPTEEVVAEGTGAISTDYRNAVLELLLKLSAAGFERLCQRLLREAGLTQRSAP